MHKKNGTINKMDTIMNFEKCQKGTYLSKVITS